MENVVLTVHLIVAVCLIGVVLMQRSEGGGLGIGGGGGGGMSTGRSAATALSKVTWLLAIGFLCTSMTLTVLAAKNSSSDSVIERIGVEDDSGNIQLPPLPPSLEGDLTPPSPSDGPALPPAPE